MQMKPIEYRSVHSFDETLDAVRQAIGKAGLFVFAEIDHAKAARAAGLSMPQTHVLVYGNAKAGTPMMLEVPLAALDLPLRILIRELPGENSAIAFHPMSDTFAAIGIKGSVAERFDDVQRTIARAIDCVRVQNSPL